MNQPPDAVAQRMITMMATKTPAERLRMASRMFATARALVQAGEDGEYQNQRARLFARFYAGDFGDEERARIIAYLTHSGGVRG